MSAVGKRFKERLKNGEKLFGTHVWMNDFTITEIFGNHGYDYVWIDTEHTAMDYQALNMNILTAQAKGMAAIVRVPFVEPFLAKRVLEMGPDGIIFPMTNTAQQVREAMSHCVYPPNGNRGFGPCRAADYGMMPPAEYLASIDDSLCRFVQIEQMEAVENLDEILQVPYVDGLVVGPMDLSLSMGHACDIYGAAVHDVIDGVVKKASAAGMPVGTSVTSEDEKSLRYWADLGLQFMSGGGDSAFLNSGSIHLLQNFKKAFG